MKKQPMTIADLLEKLAIYDPDMPVSVFTGSGDYGRPQVTLIMKSKRGKLSTDRVLIAAEEDE